MEKVRDAKMIEVRKILSTLLEDMKVFVIFIILAMYSEVCFSTSCPFLENNGGYTYLDKGYTGVVFIKDGKAFKVPYNSDAIDTYFNDGYEVATHEFQLLSTLELIIKKSQVKGIRPLKFVRAVKLDDPILTRLAQSRITKALETETWVDKIELNGVLVSEYVKGRNYYNEILNSKLVSNDEKRRYTNKFHKILLALEQYILSNPDDFTFIMREKVEDVDFESYDHYNYIETVHPKFEGVPNNMNLKLLNPYGKKGLLKAFTISLQGGLNVVVDENDDFVIVDPH